ncbi:MAG: ferrous iron transport protein B [Lentisphaerae bacterium]|nr:ferrous iron transport protein B [Lentisphaerota bacterium]
MARERTGVAPGVQRPQVTVALAGNPNSGKTTLFNALTGARQHVGNYPGVTVEKKEGDFEHDGMKVHVIDLPGTYSLTAYSPEELVARNVVLNEAPDMVVDVVDASNLERNLYLAVQFMELGIPMILAFNMSDLAEARGHSIDIERLSELFQVPIIRMVAHKGEGLHELKQAIIQVAGQTPPQQPTTVKYGRHIEAELTKLTESLAGSAPESGRPTARWLALKLLEGDEAVVGQIRREARNAIEILQKVDESRNLLARELGDDAEILIADRRYGFISGACQEAVRSTVETRHSMSDRIDLVLTHRVLSIPIFLLMMFLVFKLTFAVGDPLMGWIEDFFAWLGDTITAAWPEGAAPLLLSLIVDGIIGGVGGVLVFLPNILLLFLAIAILEDSGYMARAAFIMDRFMHKIGLHGKSFIPMLIGFGCTVPAIMATRTLENERDRLTTMLVAPLMSCGARLPIYALIIPAFFPEAWHARMLWLIYFIGIVLAIICAKLLRSTLFKGEAAPFVMELPPYRLPTVRGVFVHMWERGWLYLKKAGTLILGVSIIMWALLTFPQETEYSRGYEQAIKAVSLQQLPAEEAVGLIAELEQARASEELANSFAGRIGHAIEPLIKPLGFDWKIGTASIGAFAAKEVFVAQMGIVYSVGEADEESVPLRDKLRDNYSPLVGFCIMLFSLISAPCMATIAVTRRESNSWKWALFQLGGLTVLAYGITLIVYQVGSAFGIGI